MKINKLHKISICIFLVVVMTFTATACNTNPNAGSNVEEIDMLATLSLDVGDEYTMQVSLLPFGTEATITWKSSNTSVATVSNTGVIKAVSAGTTLIRASAGGKTADCTVTVVDPTSGEVVVTGVSLNIGRLNLEVGQKYSLTATVTPSNATNTTLTWSSSKASVAKVSNSGEVEAVASGNAIITATSSNGKKANCIVNVGSDATEEVSNPLYVRKINDLEGRDDFIMGMDASAVPSLNAAGVVYRDFDGEVKDVFAILKDNGITDIRIRIWNDPYQAGHSGDVEYSYGGGNCDVNNAVEIAKRCKDAGLGVIVDFHYSDFWADPGKQYVPKAWKGKSVAELENLIEEFTATSLNAIKDTGVKITMVQVGNETTRAICGVSYDKPADFCALLNAGAKAVRDVTGSVAEGGAKVAIHLTNPESRDYPGYAKTFEDYNVDYDVFGSSYYPAWHGTLANLADKLKKVHDGYGKEVMVLETSYPFTEQDFDGTGNTAVNNGNRPFTVQGQANQILDVIETIAELGDYGLGVCYWEGTWIAPADNRADTIELCNRYGCGWASAKAGPTSIGGDGYQANDVEEAGGVVIENQAFFRSSDGQVLESLKLFKLAKDGQIVDSVADYVYVEEAYYTVDDPDVTITLPETVTVALNDGSVIQAEALWDIDAGEVAKWIHTVDDYVVTGTTIFGGEAYCMIYVQNKNLLVDGGFEDTEGYYRVDNKIDIPAPWQAERIKKGSVLQLYVSYENQKMGKNSFHFWDSADIEFKLYQMVDVAGAVSEYGHGKFTFSIDFMGEDCGDTQELYSYAKITYKDGSTATTLKGSEVKATEWNDWHRSSVDVEIDANVATVEVGFYVKAEAGGWGNLDNAQFFYNSSSK